MCLNPTKENPGIYSDTITSNPVCGLNCEGYSMKNKPEDLTSETVFDGV